MLSESVYSLVAGGGLSYVDGGTGSLIFQVAIGGALSGIYFVTTQWKRMKNWFSGKNRRDSAPADL